MYVGPSKRLIVSLIVIEAIVMAIVLWRGAQLLDDSYTRQYKQALENESAMLAISLSDGLVQFDQRGLQKQLSHWQGRDEIIYIVLFNHKMDVMASIGAFTDGRPELSEMAIDDAIVSGFYHVSQPVELEGERIGTLRLGYQTAQIKQSIEQAQWQNMLVPLLLFFIIAVTTVLYGRRISTNLNSIQKGIEEFHNGHFDYHIQTRRDGIFSDIADVLNRFARALRNKIGDLNVGNERLQESVAALQLEIAARNETEAELRALQQRMLLQRAQSPIGIIDWSTDFRVIDWNPAAEQIFGYSKDEALGQSAIDLVVPAEIEEEIFNNIWQELLDQRGGEQSINDNVTKDGRAITCEWYNTAIVDDSSKVIGVFSLIVDITEKRKQQQMLQRSQKMDSLGKLTGGIAHDYNNMLGVVLGYASMLKKMLQGQPKLEGYVEQIQHAGERGATLSKKLLAFSHNMASEPQEIDINSLLRGEQLMLEKTLTARIKLIFELENKPWLIWVDQSDLVDAILNMSINAMHAMPDGGQLTIHTQNVALDHSYKKSMGLEPGDYMVLSLTDTGSGIDQENQAKIFEPFFTTKGEGGSGLGLSQVYGFMQRAGGAINLYSDVGHGARFALYFPRYIHDEAMVVDSGSKVEPAATGEVAANRGRGETILVVDDEEGLRTVTAEYLGSLGYQVITAENGKVALELLKSRHVDLLLSDIVMPEMDGYQLAKWVKELYPEIKIQLASGYNDERHQSFATSELRAQMLHKPFKLDSLLIRVRELLDEGGDNEVVELKSVQPYINWSEQAMTGIGEIDDDHRVLFELLNRSQQLASNKSVSDLRTILDELLDYTEYHFRREELIMAACEYPHLDNHKKVHNMLIKRTTQLITDYERGELKPTKLLDFIRDWLLDHIMTMDKAIAPYCEGREVEIKEALKVNG